MVRERRPGREERIAASLDWLARYEPLIDDKSAFLAAIEPHAPIDLLVPGGDESRATVANLLGARGVRTQGFDWAPTHLRVEAQTAPTGSLPEVAFGLAFRQGVVSSVPCRLLDPRPGELVLDLCAAPGGKTVLLASLAGDRCRILAGDPSAQRAGLLVQSLSRMGITSAVTVQQDGNSFPAAGLFDAILLDAPCTGEGTFRVARPRYEPSGERGLLRSRALQRRLLGRALDLLAPGGRLVYSTCSYAPEENEGVVSDLLSRRDDIDLLPLPGGLPGCPGVVRWGEARFDERLARARRFYPHQTGSWGFFACLLHKDPASAKYSSGARREDRPSVMPEDDPALRGRLAGALAGFGVRSEQLEPWLVMPRAGDGWILSRASGRSDVDLARLRIVAPGLRALRSTRRGPRLTNAVLRALGDQLRERVIEVDWSSAIEMLEEGRRISAPPAMHGQVALRGAGRVIAAGYARGGEVELELPKAWR